MPKGIPNKRYAPEFKQQVVETMRKEALSCRETAKRFEIPDDKTIAKWERVYLTEGVEGLCIERRGRKKGDGPTKPLSKAAEKDLLTENQRLRAEVDYLKSCGQI